MSYTNGLDKPNEYFNTVLYTGNSSTNAITGVGFQPDWTWLKCRSSAQEHNLFDIVRGTQKGLQSDSSNVEYTGANTLTSFDSDGFTLGNNSTLNFTGRTHVAWNWLGGGTASSNTDGDITSSVSVNSTSNFSIVTWTGDGNAASTVGHGLGVIPSVIFVKGRSVASNWRVKHKDLSSGYNMFLNETNAEQQVSTSYASGGIADLSSSSTFGFINGTSNVDQVNGSGSTFVAYCFAEKKGFSKFGTYVGNGSVTDSSSAVDGTFVYTGFRPAFVMWKTSSAAGGNWVMVDNTRNTTNVNALNGLFPNLNNAEGTSESHVDLVSNGFKFRSSSNNNFNYTGVTYIYMAFAENPFVTSTGIPATAR